jgi:hypothetical protein
MVQTNVLGPTPGLLAYNCGHFFPGSNTRDWWRYAGVRGARMFISPSTIEATDDLPPVGDGVTNQASFLARRAALRADPLNLNYINWSYFSNRFETKDLYPNNHIRVNYALDELRRLGVETCAQITASESRFPIAGPEDWGGKWELWQHFYAHSFYLARVFGIRRFAMYNEPNHPNANGLTISNYIMRLQLASDAIQSALADVNRLYGSNLVANIYAPVAAGSATSAYPDWGRAVVTNRHTDFLGVTDTNFWLSHVYAYQSYGASPTSFGSSLSNLHQLLTADMAPEPRFPTALTEFNTRTGADYDQMVETLDTPSEYARFGAIAVNLVANDVYELYAFKFAQTEYSGNYPVQKNGMHYVDNTNAPYSVGGITGAGEVWRLFNKAFAPGRLRLAVSKSGSATNLDVHGCFDPDSARYYLFSANTTAAPIPLTLDLSAWNIAPGNPVEIEEVSAASQGAVAFWTNLPAGGRFMHTQPAYSVWLLSAFQPPSAPPQVIVAAHDAEVRDGSNRTRNYGTAPWMVVRNDPTNANNRSAALIQFSLAGLDRSRLRLALLSFSAASATVNTGAQAFVYGVQAASWTQDNVTWSNAPALRQNVPAGNTIQRAVIAEVGSNAFILGQVTTSSTNLAQRYLDVTEFLRGLPTGQATFLVVQDPRWDISLPSLQPGDTQADGLKLATIESGNGPSLLLFFGNRPPVAVPDRFVLPRNRASVLDVLTNDLDGDGDSLAVVSVTPGSAGGSTAIGGDGRVIYTPTFQFAGRDEFQYTVGDGHGGTASASVSVLVFPCGQPYDTNRTVAAEAVIRGGAYANQDQDEAALGYLMVKYDNPPFDFARKTYFQFDLTGLPVDTNAAATFTVVTHTQTFRHRAQLWGLAQAYPGFHAGLTWNSAQANATNSNEMLTSGPWTAIPIGPSYLFAATASQAHQFTLPRLGDFLFEDRLVLVLTGVADSTNDAGGLRLARQQASLQVRVVPPEAPSDLSPPFFSSAALGGDGAITLELQGAPNWYHLLQTSTQLVPSLWMNLATGLAGAGGKMVFTDQVSSEGGQRFYRAALVY